MLAKACLTVLTVTFKWAVYLYRPLRQDDSQGSLMQNALMLTVLQQWHLLQAKAAYKILAAACQPASWECVEAVSTTFMTTTTTAAMSYV